MFVDSFSAFPFGIFMDCLQSEDVQNAGLTTNAEKIWRKHSKHASKNISYYGEYKIDTKPYCTQNGDNSIEFWSF